MKALSEAGLSPHSTDIAIRDYLYNCIPDKRLFSAEKTGWWNEGEAFVLPHRTLGREDVVYQSLLNGKEDIHQYSTGGEFDEWKKMTQLATGGNHILAFSIACAFVGPLMKFLRMDGAIAALFGDTTGSKTTSAHAAASAWGKPRLYKSPWDNTLVGMEIIATLRSDTFLVLDESGRVDPEVLDDAVYMLESGNSRGRGTTTADNLKSHNRWRNFALSTGEKSLAVMLAAAGIEVASGQEVRFLDIPVGVNGEELRVLHGCHSPGELAEYIDKLSDANYGHAGIAFIEKLIAELKCGLDLEAEFNRLLAKFSFGEDKLARRGAKVFAAVALAGELATRWGIVLWTEGMAIAAAVEMFERWVARRAVVGSGSESARIKAALLGVIAGNESRFSDLKANKMVRRETDAQGNKTETVISTKVRDRLGWFVMVDDDDNEVDFDTADPDFGHYRKIFLFEPESFKKLLRFDFNRVWSELKAAGAIFKTDKDKRTVKRWIPGEKLYFNLYAIDISKLEA